MMYYEARKPWYAIRSRFELQPDSGGINGQPSLADPENGQRRRDEIVRILAGKVRNIVQVERNLVREQS
jgi:creatinine amidohydrolase